MCDEETHLRGTGKRALQLLLLAAGGAHHTYLSFDERFQILQLQRKTVNDEARVGAGGGRGKRMAPTGSSGDKSNTDTAPSAVVTVIRMVLNSGVEGATGRKGCWGSSRWCLLELLSHPMAELVDLFDQHPRPSVTFLR